MNLIRTIAIIHQQHSYHQHHHCVNYSIRCRCPYDHWLRDVYCAAFSASVSTSTGVKIPFSICFFRSIWIIGECFWMATTHLAPWFAHQSLKTLGFFKPCLMTPKSAINFGHVHWPCEDGSWKSTIFFTTEGFFRSSARSCTIISNWMSCPWSVILVAYNKVSWGATETVRPMDG